MVAGGGVEGAWCGVGVMGRGELAGVAEVAAPAAEVATMPELQAIAPEPVLAGPLPPASETAPEPADVDPRR